jgi:hypothetical protein
MILLRLAAPYLAVAVFWLFFENAWLALLAYHAQILWWARGTRPRFPHPRKNRGFLLIPLFALAGPALAVLLPRIATTDPSAWLARYHLTGSALLAMVVYFGIVHPVLEQIHWARLREHTPWAHVAFAGYHGLVLWSLLPVGWLVVTFVLLAVVSRVWARMARDAGSLIPAIVAQVVADLGVVLVAYVGFAP